MKPSTPAILWYPRPFSKGIGRIIRFFIVIGIFSISMTIGSLYSDGDQRIYTSVYNAIGNMGISQAFAFYTYWLTSIELTHFLTIWLASGHVSKVLLFSFINTLLASLTIKFFDSLKVHFLVTASFILTNYYIYVLYFAAERLKFAVIFIVAAAWLYSSKKLRIFSVLLSILSHFSMIIVYVGIFAERFARIFSKFLSAGKIPLGLNLIFILGLIILIPIALPFALDFFSTKFMAYYGNNSPDELVRGLIFLCLTLIYTPKSYKKRYVIILFLPLLLAIILVGGDRVNMFCYMFFLFFALQYNKGLNFGILITSLYFLIKTIFFILSIVYFGHGFASIF